MAAEYCVKVSYKGLTRHVLCNTKFQYEELVKIVMDKFNIDSSCKLAIEFYDEQGHKYNKDTFEYLLLLFPNPQKIFFIRLDAEKIYNLLCAEDNSSDDRMAFGKSKLNNRQSTKNRNDTYCEAVPVRRQNCFLGEFPGLTSTEQQTSCTSNLEYSDELSLEIVKRLRQIRQSPPKKKHLNNVNISKRSLRI